MSKNIVYNNYQRNKHIKKKKNIIKYVYGIKDNNTNPLYIDGKLDKGKIHCTCSICQFKIRTHGYTHRDLKKIEKCKYDLISY